MMIDFDALLLPILTAGVLGIFTVAWQTYNKFIVMLSQIEYIVKRLEKYEKNHEDIFTRLHDIEIRIAKIEN